MIETFDGLCGIIASFASSDLQLRCLYEMGHQGPCSFEKYKHHFRIFGGCGPNPEWIRERGFIDSVLAERDKMNKKEVFELIKQYSHDTKFLSSFAEYDHPAYLKLKEAGTEIIPFLLERLQDSIGHDSGEDFDWDNSPWVSIALLGDITNGECFAGFPQEYAGQLDKLRAHILAWAPKSNTK